MQKQQMVFNQQQTNELIKLQMRYAYIKTTKDVVVVKEFIT